MTDGVANENREVDELFNIATILQLAGVLPNLFPVWYSLCRMGVAIIAVLIATWMARIYWHHGVWAMGKKK